MAEKPSKSNLLLITYYLLLITYYLLLITYYLLLITYYFRQAVLVQFRHEKKGNYDINL